MRIHELIQTTVAAKINITPKDVELYRNSHWRMIRLEKIIKLKIY